MTSFSEGTAAWPAKTWLSGVGKVCENGKVSACCLFAVPLFVVQSDLAGRTDPTFVLAAENAEEAILAPLRRPAVRDDPVLGVVLDAPADNLHGVATLDGVPHLPPVALVNAALVRHEALVHREASLNRSVRHNSLLDILLRLKLERVRRLVLRVRLSVHARVRAMRRLARPRAVREAAVRDDASFLEVLPRVREVTSAAAVVRHVARHEVLGAEHNVRLALRGDSQAVRQRLGGGERPARAASLLVADGMNVVRPLLTRVEALGDAVVGDVLVRLLRDALSDGRVELRSEELARLLAQPAVEVLVVASLPLALRVGVHGVNDERVVHELARLLGHGRCDGRVASGRGGGQEHGEHERGVHHLSQVR